MSTADALKEQAIKHYEQYDYEAAARTFQDARDAYAEAGQLDMVAEMLVNIGLTHKALGEAQQALDLMQEALRTFQDQGDQIRMAQVLGNLGGVYVSLNDKEQAELSYRQAAQIFEELGEEALYSDTMIALSAMQVRGGKLLMGAQTYQMAVKDKQDLTGTQKVLKHISQFMNRVTGMQPA